jgi:hypothetical protein
MMTPDGPRLRMGLALCVLFAASGAARAQTPRAKGPRIELGVGAVWTRGASFGSSNANEIAPNGTNVALFDTSNSLTAATGVEAQLGFRVTSRFWVEASGSWSHVQLVTRESADFEGQGALTLAAPASQFTAEGSALWCFKRRRRVEPFVRVGVGWMRDLTSDTVLATDGLIATVGGGMKYWWREPDRGWLRRIGLRADVRAVLRTGLSLTDRRRMVSPAVCGSAVIGF